MLRLQGISNELLLSIAGYLTQADLSRLALVSRLFALITRDVLYIEPSITHPDTGIGIISLLTAIHQYPGLANSIRRLGLTVQNIDIPISNSNYETLLPWRCIPPKPYSEVREEARDTVLRGLEAVGIPISWQDFPSVSVQLHRPAYQRSRPYTLEDSNHADFMIAVKAWSQPAFCAALLMMLPNLEYLSIGAADRNLKNHTMNVFPKYPYHGPRLLALKHLNIDRGHAALKWFDLPSLQTLQWACRAEKKYVVSTVPNILDPGPELRSVTRIVVDCNTAMLDYRSDPQELVREDRFRVELITKIQRYMKRCPRLIRVDVNFPDRDFESMKYYMWRVIIRMGIPCKFWVKGHVYIPSRP